MKKGLMILIILLLGIMIVCYIGSKKEPVGEDEMKTNKINIEINGKNYTATLEDNETTRKLIEELPLEITMDELNGNEKYYYLSTSLPTNTQSVKNIEVGDIMLYGDDCFVIFYESFKTSYSYTRIGKIENPSSLKEDVGEKSIEVLITK